MSTLGYSEPKTLFGWTVALLLALNLFSSSAHAESAAGMAAEYVASKALEVVPSGQTMKGVAAGYRVEVTPLETREYSRRVCRSFVAYVATNGRSKKIGGVGCRDRQYAGWEFMHSFPSWEHERASYSRGGIHADYGRDSSLRCRYRRETARDISSPRVEEVFRRRGDGVRLNKPGITGLIFRQVVPRQRAVERETCGQDYEAAGRTRTLHGELIR